jgi:hypothetical protein
MLDFWDEEVKSGEKRKIKVFVINDTHNKWSGTVRLRIVRGDGTVSVQMKDCDVGPLGREILTFEQKFPEQAGEYKIVGELVKVYDDIVRSYRDFKIISANNQD